MATEHVDIADGERHEPKGAAAATVDQIMTSDGAAGTAWGNAKAEKITVADAGSYFTGGTAELALQELGARGVFLNGVIADISTASSILIPVPTDCTIVSVKSILGGAISGSDATLTIIRGGDNASMGSIVVANSGSAEGDADENATLSNATFTFASHKYIKITTDGASTGTFPIYIQVKLTL